MDHRVGANFDLQETGRQLEQGTRLERQQNAGDEKDKEKPRSSFVHS
jgi:hypothetical protein